MLTIKEASYSYDKKHNVFENISFSLKKGETLCILGPNGTGKSTLIKCLGNILEFDRGTLFIGDRDITTLSKNEIARKIGYVPQTSTDVFPFTVLDFVLMGRAPHLPMFSSPQKQDHRIAQKALQRAGILHLKDCCVTQISGGERQLALIARALAQEPEILLLDEPTAHLDFGNQIRMLKLIDSLTTTSIIMSTHFPDHALMGSKTVAIMLENRFIAHGSAREVITKKNMALAYGIDVTIDHIESAKRKVCLAL